MIEREGERGGGRGQRKQTYRDQSRHIHQLLALTNASPADEERGKRSHNSEKGFGNT